MSARIQCCSLTESSNLPCLAGQLPAGDHVEMLAHAICVHTARCCFRRIGELLVRVSRGGTIPETVEFNYF